MSTSPADLAREEARSICEWMWVEHGIAADGLHDRVTALALAMWERGRDDAANAVQRMWQDTPNVRTDSALTSFQQNGIGQGCSAAIKTIRALAATEKNDG